MTIKTAVTQTVVAKASRWEDFVDIFISPKEVFERRRDGRFGVALAVLTVLLTVLTYGYYSALSTAFEGDIARSAALAGEEAAQSMEMMAKFGQSLAIFGSLLTVPLGVFFSGLCIWIVARVFGGRLSVGLGVTIATFAAFPRIFTMLSGILQGILFNPDSLTRISAGPARFLDPGTTSTAMIAAASRIDLFVLWSVILTAIGLRIIAGLRQSSAYMAAILLWLAGALLAMGSSIITSGAGT